MRKLFLILLIAFSFTASAQKADTTKTPASKADTTKPKQYYLVGELIAWQAVYKAINEPMKMTREEIAALNQWLQLLKELPEQKKNDK